MAGSLSPYVRTPLTDITGSMVSHQLHGNCPRQEMLYMECLEAYGLGLGKQKCSKLLDNLYECQTNLKQYKRYMAMQRERTKQINSGKLKGDERYLNPVIDSY